MDRCCIRHQLFLKPLAVMVLTVALAVIASAQTFRKTSPAYPYDVGGNVSSPVKIILGVLIFGMFFIAFVSLYLRTCIHHSSDETGPTNIPVTNNNRIRRKFPCGLDRSVIESFPVFLYSDVKQRMIGDRALECAVCISEFADDERLRFLPKCQHVFHPECIDAWLATHTTCPVCRADLTTANVDGDTEFNHELIRVRIDGSRTEIETQNHDSINVEQQQQPATRLPRSHSTGHSLVTPGENCERFTLRLPVEVQNQIVALRRAKSCGCDVDGKSIRRCGGEGSTGGRRWTPDRIICGRLDQRELTVMRMPTLEVETDPAESSSSSSTSAGLHV